MWPGVEKSQQRPVYFYNSRQAALDDTCLGQHGKGVSDLFSAPSARLQMGEMCGRLFVLLHDPAHEKISTVARDFAAAHETFHLAGQIFGGATPDLIFAPRPRVTPGADRFFAYLASSLNGAGKSVSEQTISDISKAYEALSVDEKNVVDFYSVCEWPAEFYAYKVLESQEREWTLDRYLGVRKEIGDELSYRVAIPVGLALDRQLGNGQWEARVFQGESMFGILTRIFAPSPQPNFVFYKVTSFDLAF